MKTVGQQVFEAAHYNLLWHVAESCFELAKRDKKNEKFQCLAGMLMISFSFEAFMNHILSLVSPDVFMKERSYFGSGEYQGTLGKYAFLVKCLDMTAANKATRPYQSLKKLFIFRDLAVHAKPERGFRLVRVQRDNQVEDFTSVLDKTPSLKTLERMQKDVSSILVSIEKAAKSKHPRVFGNHQSLHGAWSMSITTYERKCPTRRCS